MSILTTEFNLDIAKKVWAEESKEEMAIEIARNALREGATMEFARKITGLAIEAIQRLQMELKGESDSQTP